MVRVRDGHGPARLLTGAAPLSPHQHEARVTTESAGIQIITGVQVSVVSLGGGGGGVDSHFVPNFCQKPEKHENMGN